MSELDNKIIVGQINGIYGVQGWVKVFSHTEHRQDILSYVPWLVKVNGAWQTVQVTDGKSMQGGKSVIAKLDGVEDRDQARAYMGCDIAILPSQLPESDDGFYWLHLIGCQVFNLENEALGEVTGIVETGAHDVLRVASTSDEGIKLSTLIPFVMEQFIIEVDTSAKKIIVDWHLDEMTEA